MKEPPLSTHSPLRSLSLSLAAPLLNELVVQFLVSSFNAPSAELIAQLTKEGARQDEAEAAEDSYTAGCPVYFFFVVPPTLPSTSTTVLMVASNVTLRLKFRSNEV